MSIDISSNLILVEVSIVRIGFVDLMFSAIVDVWCQSNLN